MNMQMNRRVTTGWLAILLGCGAVLLCGLPRPALSQPPRRISIPNFPEGMPIGMDVSSSSGSPSSGKDAGGPWLPAEPPPMSLTTNLDGSVTTNSPEEIQLSFQGANVDMVVQWLAQTTGK